LPEQSNPTAFHRVLDIACGTGSWIIEAAKIYPEMELTGIDISKPMVEYAREQAKLHNVADRVEFHVMDALLILEFPAGFFDLVNLRFGISFLRTWDWPKLLSELQRVTRPGGVIRITDEEVINPSNSAALTQLLEMWLLSLFRSGHLFENHTTGLTTHLPGLLTRYGVQQVQTRAYALEFRAGTPEGQAYYEDMMHAFRTGRPFLARWGCVSKDYDTLYQQALAEMQQPDFCVTWNLLTAWGSNPRNSYQNDS
jgi:SAM-dependent methyltransferase